GLAVDVVAVVAGSVRPLEEEAEPKTHAGHDAARHALAHAVEEHAHVQRARARATLHVVRGVGPGGVPAADRPVEPGIRDDVAAALDATDAGAARAARGRARAHAAGRPTM